LEDFVRKLPMIGRCIHEEGGVYRVRAKDLPAALQPREKFDRLGPENLSESDLLALLLRTGTTGLNVVELAELILMQYGSLSALSRASTVELQEIHGIGKEKAKILKVVASNYTLNYKNLYPTYKEPFSFIAKGLSCSNWLPG